ncbi:MAG: roadblock/LC7 domain-containing protein [Promethearchaeota archaeon]
MSDEQIYSILKQLDKVSGIIGSVIISYPEGVPLASTWVKELKAIIASGLVSSVKIILDNFYKRFKKSQLTKVYIENKNGNYIIMNAGSKSIIVSFLTKYANIPICSFEMKNATIKIEKLLD